MYLLPYMEVYVTKLVYEIKIFEMSKSLALTS